MAKAIARITLTCPVCDSPLTSVEARPTFGSLVDEDSKLGGHIHIELVGSMTCVNSHTWQAQPGSTITLERSS